MIENKNLISTVSRKGQTTLPASIRRLLHIEPGDSIKYEIEDDVIRIRKAEGVDLEWAIAIESTLTEWSSPKDDDL